VKQSILAVVLVACFVTAAMATDRRAPASAGEYSGLSQVRNDQPHSPATTVRCAGPKLVNYYYYFG